MNLERCFPIISNDTSGLRPLSVWALDLARGLDLPASTCHDIDLCLHEVVSNIIRHGCGDGREHHVAVRFEQAAGGVSVQVEDDAHRFDPLAVPAPGDPSALEDARTSGYGIPLLRSLTRELRYDWIDGRNRLTLVF